MFLSERGYPKTDDRLKISPGFKFNEWEMKGVPIRVEVGSRDMEAGTLLCVRRDTSEKQSYKVDSVASELNSLLNKIQGNMFNQALEFRDKNTFTAESYDEFDPQISQRVLMFPILRWDF